MSTETTPAAPKASASVFHEEIVLIAEKLGELHDRFERIESEHVEQRVPLDAAKSAQDAALAALTAALQGMKALNFHVLDNNLGAVSKRVEAVEKTTAEKDAELAAGIQKVATALQQVEQAFRRDLSAIAEQKTELGRKVESDKQEAAQSALKLIHSIAAIREELDAKIEQAKTQFSTPAALNPRGDWSPSVTYNRLDVVTLNGTSYVSRATTKEKPRPDSPDWQILARRGGMSAQAGGGVSDVTGLAGMGATGLQIAQAGTPEEVRVIVGVDDFEGATSVLDGEAGRVPKPLAGDQNKYLRADGTWTTPSSVTAPAASQATVNAGTEDAEYVSPLTLHGYINPRLAARAPLFPANPALRANSLNTAGIKELTQITCLAAAGLNNLYFRIAGQLVTGADINYIGGQAAIDVWFNVDAAGTAPVGTGASRQIAVALSAADTAAQVASAVAAALHADICFSAGSNADVVRVQSSIAGGRTDATAATSGFTITRLVDGSGLFTGSTKWVGGVLAPNGKIYCMPYTATTVLVIDPATDTVSQPITGLSGSTKWYGGVLAPNGKIYCVPYDATTVLVIDPATDTATQPITGLTGSTKWAGGVLAPNGKIYCVPLTATTVLVIDPATDTATQPITGLSGSNKWAGGVLAPNGKIYCVPLDATTVLVIDPATDTATQPITGLTAGGSKWIGGVLAPNGKIYCVPLTATTVLVIDPATDTATQPITGLTGGAKWVGGVLAPNGKIYYVPTNATTVLVIDPATDTATQPITGLIGASKWHGGVLAPNGKIYCVPIAATTVLVVDPGLPATFPQWMLSPHFNKL